MRTDLQDVPARTRIAGAIAGAVLLVGLSTAPAGAAPQEVSAPVTGSLTVNAGASPFADGTVYFIGTFDPETGDLVGTFTFPPGQTSTDLAVVTRQVTQTAPGAGSVDLDTGAATFTAGLVLSLEQITVPALSITDAPLDPCTYVMTLDLTGTFDAATRVLSLSEDGFAITVNPADPPDRCLDPANPFAGIVNPAIDAAVLGDDGAGVANAFAATFDVGVAQVPPPPPSVPPAGLPPTQVPPTQVPPADPPAAPPATPVAAQPTFTG